MRETRLAEARQLAARNEGRIRELEDEKVASAERHYKQVTELSAKVQDLLASQVCMKAAHRREASGLREELDKARSELAEERASLNSAREATRALQVRGFVHWV